MPRSLRCPLTRRRAARRHTHALGNVYRLVMQDWSVLRWAGDKRLTHQMAREAGVPYPGAWYPRTVNDLTTLDTAYPVIVKAPALFELAESSLGAIRCRPSETSGVSSASH